MSNFSDSSIGQELSKIGKGMSKAGASADQDSKKPYSDQSTSYHKGGEIPADGNYKLKAGEHVLTAAEAAKARKHALMVSGMKSLALAAPVKNFARKG